MKTIVFNVSASLIAVVSFFAAKAATMPSAQGLLKVSQGEYTAFQHRDWKTMQSLTSDDFLYVGPEGRLSGRELAEATSGCILRSFALSSPQLKQLGATSAVLSYVAQQDETCGDRQMPATLLNADLFVLTAGRWIVSTHMEVAIPSAITQLP